MKPPHLSPYMDVGSLIFLSGQLPFDSRGRISEAGLAGQTDQVLANIEGVLRTLGLGRENIVKTTVWLRPGSDFATFNDSYAAFFGAHRPARSTVFSELALPAAAVEIEAVARRP
jgi:2-iminobutanoate/2-iminopropanoate deaminase